MFKAFLASLAIAGALLAGVSTASANEPVRAYSHGDEDFTMGTIIPHESIHISLPFDTYPKEWGYLGQEWLRYDVERDTCVYWSVSLYGDWYYK